MGRWRSLQELRDAYAASGLELAKKHPQCRGKVRYAMQADAERHCDDLAANDANEHPVLRARLNVYDCRWCKGLHVGHLPKRPGKRSKKPTRH